MTTATDPAGETCPGCEHSEGVQLTRATMRVTAWTCTCGLNWATSVVNLHLRPQYPASIAAAVDDHSGGELARAALAHLVTSRPELSPVLGRAISLPTDTARFDPATLAVGGLVMIALQTELKLSRNESGQWRFSLHKKPMRDSTLGRVLAKLIGLYGTIDG